MNLTGRFILDGYDLYEAFNVVVQEAQGLDVLPKVKKRDEYDWPEESGIVVDATTDLTYEAHDITLDCYVQESTYADAVKRINGVVKLLSGDGLHLLGSQLRQRLYPVLLQEVTGYKRITPASASSIYVQFTLKLRCPMPETRIGNVTVAASGQVTLVVPTGKDFTVWWGDGTVNENTLTHTYTEAGTYTVLIAGTGVTSAVITGVNVDEFSYPATGDIIHVDVSHTSEEAYQKALNIESNAYFKMFEVPINYLVSGDYFNSAKIASSANYTSALQMDKLIMIPFSVSNDITIDSAMLRVYSGVTGTKIRIGIYDGSPFYPYGLIWASSEIATDTAGVKSSSIPNLVLQKNKMYWFAYIANSSEPRIYNYQTYQTAIIKAANAQAGYNELYISMNYGEIPSNLDGLTMNDCYTYFPIISLKKA